MILLNSCEQKAPKLEVAKIGKNNVSDVISIKGEKIDDEKINKITSTTITGEQIDAIDSEKVSSDTIGTIDESNPKINPSSKNPSSKHSNSKKNKDIGYNSSNDKFKSIYFGFGKYAISSQMLDRMTHNAKIALSSSSKIKIEGNCDEFGTDEYNYALGLKRAKIVKDTLQADGVSRDNMVLVSFGESSPICTEFTDSCYDRNRRVDIHLIK